ncbi:MAG: sigma-70 family RNA polymerase sigma factor [Phototrophicaceae bacterium]
MDNRNPLPATDYQGFDPDWALLRAMADGDVRALNEVYARYGPMLLGFLSARLPNRQLAEEVLQDVMLAVWDNAHKFEARSKVKTWLLVIARNRAINATRRKKLPLIDISQVFDLSSDDTGPMDAVVRHEEQDTVRHAIQKLPEGQREVLVLVFYHQLSGPEVAEVLDISEGTVKSRLHRAKENLKGYLAQENTL